MEVETTQAPLLGEPLPVELMNTIWADRDGVHDALGTPDLAVTWLAAVGHGFGGDVIELRAWLDDAGAPAVRHLAERLRRLRDALRRLAAEVTADPRPAAASATRDRDRAIADINQASAAAPTWSELAWTPGQPPHARTRTTHNPADLVVAVLAAAAVDLFTGPQRGELRACLGPSCVLYFVKQHPRREWCSATCGNRVRVARHYQRHRASDPAR